MQAKKKIMILISLTFTLLSCDQYKINKDIDKVSNANIFSLKDEVQVIGEDTFIREDGVIISKDEHLKDIEEYERIRKEAKELEDRKKDLEERNRELEDRRKELEDRRNENESYISTHKFRDEFTRKTYTLEEYLDKIFRLNKDSEFSSSKNFWNSIGIDIEIDGDRRKYLENDKVISEREAFEIAIEYLEKEDADDKRLRVEVVDPFDVNVDWDEEYEKFLIEQEFLEEELESISKEYQAKEEETERKFEKLKVTMHSQKMFKIDDLMLNEEEYRNLKAVINLAEKDPYWSLVGEDRVIGKNMEALTLASYAVMKATNIHKEVVVEIPCDHREEIKELAEKITEKADEKNRNFSRDYWELSKLILVEETNYIIAQYTKRHSEEDRNVSQNRSFYIEKVNIYNEDNSLKESLYRTRINYISEEKNKRISSQIYFNNHYQLINYLQKITLEDLNLLRTEDIQMALPRGYNYILTDISIPFESEGNQKAFSNLRSIDELPELEKMMSIMNANRTLYRNVLYDPIKILWTRSNNEVLVEKLERINHFGISTNYLKISYNQNNREGELLQREIFFPQNIMGVVRFIIEENEKNK